MSENLSTRGIKRLEMTMRDVMDGLEDSASYLNYHSSPSIIEILSIEPPCQAEKTKATVIPINIATGDVVKYLTQRELKHSA